MKSGVGFQAHRNYSFAILLSYLGTIFCFSPSWILLRAHPGAASVFMSRTSFVQDNILSKGLQLMPPFQKPENPLKMNEQCCAHISILLLWKISGDKSHWLLSVALIWWNKPLLHKPSPKYPLWDDVYLWCTSVQSECYPGNARVCRRRPPE